MILLGQDQPTIQIHPMYYMYIVSAPVTVVRLNVVSATISDCMTGRVTINILPDDILLLIFHFDRVTYIDGLAAVDYAPCYERRLLWRWHRLVWVCQRWRSIVFASQKFLKLALLCGPRTRMALINDIWPPLPIIIRIWDNRWMPDDYDFRAAITGTHPNRVIC